MVVMLLTTFLFLKLITNGVLKVCWRAVKSSAVEYPHLRKLVFLFKFLFSLVIKGKLNIWVKEIRKAILFLFKYKVIHLKQKKNALLLNGHYNY